MKHKIFLAFMLSFLFAAAYAQKKEKKLTAYAITSPEKGNSKWNEVKLVDLKTGEELQSVYRSSSELPILNARTGKPVVKKDISNNSKEIKDVITIVRVEGDKKLPGDLQPVTVGDNQVRIKKVCYNRISTDKPFATNSAACAYDKKHERLYYVPMSVNQLRYIDLKSKNPSIYYFEDETFGAMSGPGDYNNQITRMAFASDGKGYALTNNGEHLFRFTTKKKAEITDLGALTDDASNGAYSIHSRGGYGGDMVADESGNLYLITANRVVFKINIETKVATWLGTIKGLPRGFTTNGAIVEKGTSIIVCSATATSGYYRFDLTDLQAEKISTGESVFNASDLANSTLISEKKKKKDNKEVTEEPATAKEETTNTEALARTIGDETISASKISIYPNPVTSGTATLLFKEFPAGRYDLQLLDASGKMLSTMNVLISSKVQLQEFRLPLQIAKGNYLVKVTAENGRQLTVEKIIVQ